MTTCPGSPKALRSGLVPVDPLSGSVERVAAANSMVRGMRP